MRIRLFAINLLTIFIRHNTILGIVIHGFAVNVITSAKFFIAISRIESACAGITSFARRKSEYASDDEREKYFSHIKNFQQKN